MDAILAHPFVSLVEKTPSVWPVAQTMTAPMIRVNALTTNVPSVIRMIMLDAVGKPLFVTLGLVAMYV